MQPLLLSSTGSCPLVTFSSPLGSGFHHGNITQGPFLVFMSVMQHHCQLARSDHLSFHQSNPPFPSSLHAAGQAAPPKRSQRPWSNVYVGTPAARWLWKRHLTSAQSLRPMTIPIVLLYLVYYVQWLHKNNTLTGVFCFVFYLWPKMILTCP